MKRQRRSRRLHPSSSICWMRNEDDQLKSVAGGATTMATVVTNLSSMRHEMLKAVAQNLRA